MNSLHGQQQWDLMRERQAEMLKEALHEHLARQVEAPKNGWLSNLFQRQAQSSASARNASAFSASATPELG